MKPLEDRIGVSTLCMPRIPIEAAIGRIREAGFRAIQVVPVKVEHDPNVKDWRDYFTPDKRREIRALLRAFPTVTVHSSSLGVNICHPDPAQRRRAAERYDALLEFAVDVGAPTVTLHAGDAGDPAETDRYHVEYGQRAAAYAAEQGLVAGYEFFRPEVIAQIRRLAPTHSDAQIADILNQEGWRTARGHLFLPSRVASLRRSHQIAKVQRAQ